MTIKLSKFQVIIGGGSLEQDLGSKKMHPKIMKQKELAKISKALGDPTRLRIYEAISSKSEMYCGELMKQCPLTPGTISHHLKILAEAKLIESRREGQFIYNRVLPETMHEFCRALSRIAGNAKAPKV